jgi:2-hydroxychromene-2-carboxylate isomerase
MFVLLARDPSAPQFVDDWADKRAEEIDIGRRPPSDRAQVAEARGCAQRMREWREENDGAWREGLFGQPK